MTVKRSKYGFLPFKIYLGYFSLYRNNPELRYFFFSYDHLKTGVIFNYVERLGFRCLEPRPQKQSSWNESYVDLNSAKGMKSSQISILTEVSRSFSPSRLQFKTVARNSKILFAFLRMTLEVTLSLLLNTNQSRNSLRFWNISFNRLWHTASTRPTRLEYVKLE